MDDPQRQTSTKRSETSVENESKRSLESLSRSVEHAEERIRAMESENNQLQRELTKAVLAAARQKDARREDTELPADDARQRLEGLTNGMKIAQAARSEAARERKSAIRAVEKALREEYAQRIEAIQQSHAAELAMLSRTAEKRAREDVANQLDALTREVADARQANQEARRDHEKALRETEELLVQKYSRQIDEQARTYADNLEKLSRLNKEQFAEELMLSLSTAHASWREETKTQIQQARQNAEKAALRDIERYQRHNKLVIRRAARVWRARERRRFSDARREWQTAHRQALDACNNRWHAKFNRLKRRARRSWWPSEHWRRQKNRIACFLSSYARTAQGEFLSRDGTMLSPAHSGIMAILLVFLGVNFSFPEGVTGPDRRAEPSAASTQAASPTELALLPRDGPGESRTSTSNPLKYSEAVEKMQRDLKRLGYSPGPVDGVLGPKTRAAIARYKNDQSRKNGTQAYRSAKGTEKMAATADAGRRN